MTTPPTSADSHLDDSTLGGTSADPLCPPDSELHSEGGNVEATSVAPDDANTNTHKTSIPLMEASSQKTMGSATEWTKGSACAVRLKGVLQDFGERKGSYPDFREKIETFLRQEIPESIESSVSDTDYRKLKHMMRSTIMLSTRTIAHDILWEFRKDDLLDTPVDKEIFTLLKKHLEPLRSVFEEIKRQELGERYLNPDPLPEWLGFGFDKLVEQVHEVLRQVSMEWKETHGKTNISMAVRRGVSSLMKDRQNDAAFSSDFANCAFRKAVIRWLGGSSCNEDQVDVDKLYQ